ncbi:MAG: hypothetical protein MJZ93_05725 [Paludibacteraceae bacterium]|nr:hypothetical protein [Paludibacteraceae bacterium]
MKKVLLAAATVAMLFATSCKKDVNAPEDIRLGENEFLATIDNGAVPQNAPAIHDGMNTMTTIDGNRRVFWQSGDVISINGAAYSAETTGNPVKFIGEGDAGSAPYHAFYPASIAGTGNAGSLPTEQIYTEANNVSNLPMYALGGADKQLTFHNICAVLKIVVPADFAGATKIEVSSDQRMNGDFTVDENYKAVMTATTPTAAEKKVSIKKSGESDATFATGDVVYIAVPAGEYTNFTVAASISDGTVLWDKTLETCTLDVNKIYPINATSENPLCFTAATGGVTVTLNLGSSDASSITFQYSTDNITWDDYTSGNPITITLANTGDKVYLRASVQHDKSFFGAKFLFSEKVNASGNIMSLYGPNCPDIKLPDNAFEYLFVNCSNLQTAPELPATQLGEACYNCMFYHCDGLQTAPELPATQLSVACYEQMFAFCDNLESAPKLEATTLANNCCYQMFANCPKLNSVPELKATMLADGCYSEMFLNCPKLRVVIIHATNASADYCLDNWLYGAGEQGGDGQKICTIRCKSVVESVIRGYLDDEVGDIWDIDATLP